MGVLITETCAGCGCELRLFHQRLGCRACFEQRKPTPVLCRTCLENHRAVVHPELAPIPDSAFPQQPNQIHRA